MPKRIISTLTGVTRSLGSTKLFSPASPRLFNYAGITAAIGLASLPAFLTLGPITMSRGVSAVDTANAETGGVATLSINPALAVTAENITVSATPTIGKTFVTTASTVNVKNTGAGGGYHLTMSSNNGGVLKTSDNAHSVNTFSEYNKTGVDMKNASASSWGYTLQTVSGTKTAPSADNGADLIITYLPIPTSSTNWNKTADQASNKYAYLKNTTGYTNTTAGDNIVVGYAFAIGPDAAVGIYTDTIIYTVIPNPYSRTLFDMTNMQDLATYTDACRNTPTPAASATTGMTSLGSTAIGATNVPSVPTKTLKDVRDNQNYIISKLADGNCWMIDNLKLADGTKLVPATSNVTAEYTLPASSGTFSPNSTMATVYTGDSPFGKEQGYFYNYIAAAAGTNPSSGNAAQDICPKGWKLPTMLDFGGLVAKYNQPDSGPFWGDLAGYLDTGGFEAYYEEGHYWSSTAQDNESAYYLLFQDSEDSSITPITPRPDPGYKYQGRFVRCVAH